MRDVNYYLLRFANEMIMTPGNRRTWRHDNMIDILHSGPHRELFQSVSQWVSEWPYFANNILNMDNWRLTNLVTEDGQLRKPKAFLELAISGRGNLSLDWYPSIPIPHNLENTDWLRWENIASSGYIPFNRIIFIREFGYYIDNESYNKAEQYLLQAVKGMIDNIYEVLGKCIDIQILNNIYLDYLNAGTSAAQLIGCRIRDIKEVKEEEKELWLRRTFNEGLRVSPKEFLEIYKSSEMKYAPTARKLSFKTQTPVSTDKIKKLINKLYHEFPRVYDEVLMNKVPRGITERKVGVVLPFTRS